MLESHARRRRPARRRRRWPALVGVALSLVLAFVVGVALGRALEEGPAPGRTVTAVRTLEPLPLPPATRTVTVTNP
jgi:ABC-type Fe3+ transport system permease subunit